MWVGTVVVGLLGVLALSGGLERGVGVAGADAAVKKVKCNEGQTLKAALQKAKPGDTLQVTGTCHERVTITTDRLTLDGGGSAVLDGGAGGSTEFFEGVVTIDGVQGVTLIGFTIQNGPSQAILGVGGAAFVVKDTTIQHNGVGIFLNNNSSAELTDVEVKDRRASVSPCKVGRRWKSGVRRFRRATTAETVSTSWTPRLSSSGIRNRRGAY